MEVIVYPKQVAHFPIRESQLEWSRLVSEPLAGSNGLLAGFRRRSSDGSTELVQEW
jgi:hypothetical protein